MQQFSFTGIVAHVNTSTEVVVRTFNGRQHRCAASHNDGLRVGDYVDVTVKFTPADGVLEFEAGPAAKTRAVGFAVNNDGGIDVVEVDGNTRPYNPDEDSHLVGAKFLPKAFWQVVESLLEDVDLQLVKSA